MSTLNFIQETSAPVSAGNAAFTLSRSRIFSLVCIAAAHLGLFYVLEHGLLSQAVQVLPKEVFVSFVESAKPKQEAPQVVPAKKLTSLSIPKPVATHINPEAEVSSPTIPFSPQATALPPQPVPVVANTEPGNAAVVVAQPRQISAVEYVRPPQAEYPSLSRRMGEEGKVTLRILVNEKGQAENVEIQKSSGSNRLDEAARIAILHAIFKPYLEDGKALTVIATATISFSLNS